MNVLFFCKPHYNCKNDCLKTKSVIAVSNKNLYIENPWIRIPLSEWNVLTKGLQPLSVKKDRIVYEQGTELTVVYIVKSGRIRLGHFTSEGEEKGIFVADEGCLFGEACAVPGYPTYYTATAAADSEIYVVPVGDFVNKVMETPELSLNVIKLMARKMRIYSAQEITLSFHDSISRVCQFLVYLAEQYGENDATGIWINLHFTHEEMANMINCSRVRVSNIFASLMKEGIIRKVDGRYQILKYDELLKITSS